MKKVCMCFVAVAVVVLSCQVAFAAAERPTAHDWFLKGMEYEKTNVFGEAVKMYTGAIALDRYYAEAYLRRGAATWAADKTDVIEAMGDFNRAIELDPKNPEAYYQRGLLNAFSLNNQAARTDMQAAASLGHNEAQQWLAPKKQEDKDAERMRATAAAASGAAEAGQAPAAGEQQAGGMAEPFFVAGKLLPSGSEPVVRFDLDRAEIKEQYYPVLDEVARILRENAPEVVIVLAGHTDATGTEKYNEGLSLRRAKAVENYLTSQRGIPSARFKLKGYGEGAPIAANDTKEGRAKNRRVEILDAGTAAEPPAAATR
ncbi:MAG: OmpA family protein [Syntrophales bacterium]